MNRDQIEELYKINKKLSRNLADLIKYIDDIQLKNIDKLSDAVSCIIKIDNILRSFDYED